MTTANWYVLYTKPHSEQQVEAGLAAEGIQSYFPAIPVATPRRGRPAVRPFFPCYLFVNVDLESVGVSRLNWTPGVRRLVMFGGIPSQVDEGVIARLQAHLAQPHVTDHAGEMLERGDKVRITSGPLKDIEAVFDKRLSANGRVRVLVELLQRWTPVEIEADALHRISPFAKAPRLRK